MSYILRVDLGTRQIIKENVPEQYKLLGGRGLTSAVISSEVPPTCDALGPENKLVIAPGLLSGTLAPSSSRTSIGAKSPLTGGIKESNVGSPLSRALSRMDIKAVIIENQLPETEWHVIHISENGVELLPANDLVGNGNYETGEKLRKQFGDNVVIMSIGQAGERMLTASTIACTSAEGYPSRHAGRGGMGAVMGSKRIKAIIIETRVAENKNAKPVNYEEFNSACKEWAKEIIPKTKGFTTFGTALLMSSMNKLGGIPVRNFRRGSHPRVEEISGEVLFRTIAERGGKSSHSCSPGCVIRCSNIYNDKNGNYLTSGFEYETIALLGPNLEIFDLDVIAQIDRMCDDFGVDTIDTAAGLGVMMDSDLLPFGDSEQALEIVSEIGTGGERGLLLGNGASAVGRKLNAKRVPVVRNQALSAYDPRACKGFASTYATSPMGGDHTSGTMPLGRGAWRGVTDTRQVEGQLEASKDVQTFVAVLDSLGFCTFVGPVPDTMKIIANLLTLFFGEQITFEDVVALGERCLNNELLFNKNAGWSKEDSVLPEFFYKEDLSEDTPSILDIPKENTIHAWDELVARRG